MYQNRFLLRTTRKKIDNNLTFHDQTISLCSKANKKVSALSRVSKHIGKKQKTHMNEILYFLTI